MSIYTHESMINHHGSGFFARLDKTHRQRSATTQPQDIGVLPEVVETKRNHWKAPAILKRRRRRPPQEAAPALAAG